MERRSVGVLQDTAASPARTAAWATTGTPETRHVDHWARVSSVRVMTMSRHVASLSQAEWSAGVKMDGEEPTASPGVSTAVHLGIIWDLLYFTQALNLLVMFVWENL